MPFHVLWMPHFSNDCMVVYYIVPVCIPIHVIMCLHYCFISCTSNNARGWKMKMLDSVLQRLKISTFHEIYDRLLTMGNRVENHVKLHINTWLIVFLMVAFSNGNNFSNISRRVMKREALLVISMYRIHAKIWPLFCNIRYHRMWLKCFTVLLRCKYVIGKCLFL